MQTREALTDEELAEKAADGSEAHFNLLVDRYAQIVYRTALGITGVPQEAEEIAQETFLKVFKNLRHFSPAKAAFKTWVLTIARNQSINAFASLKRRAMKLFSESHRENNGTEAEQNFFSDRGPDPEALLSIQQEFSRTARAVRQLPERQRTALLLKAVEGLSYTEIARIMDTSPSSVESLIFRARRTLLDVLEE